MHQEEGSIYSHKQWGPPIEMASKPYLSVWTPADLRYSVLVVLQFCFLELDLLYI
jgi:hypothetical protein